MNPRHTLSLLTLAIACGGTISGGALGGGFNVPRPREKPVPVPGPPLDPLPWRRPIDPMPFLPRLEAPEVVHVETKGRKKGSRAQRKAAREGAGR